MMAARTDAAAPHSHDNTVFLNVNPLNKSQ